MNAASIVMRQWRRAQTTQSAFVALDLPDKVRTAHSVALAFLLAEAEAQALANTGLSAAQAAWDTERAEAEALRSELETAQAQIARHIEQQTHQQVRGEALHADLASTQATAQAECQQHTEQRKQSAQEALRVAERMTQAEADRDQERREAGKAREEAARLQGMVQAMTSQNAELMRAVAGGAGTGKKKDQ